MRNHISAFNLPVAGRWIAFVASAALPCCAWANPAPAGASDDAASLASLSLEQLMEMRVDHVYGASRYEQKVTRAPASVSIITADEIRRYGHRTLADVLKSVRSLYVSNDRNYTYLGVRGFMRSGDYNTRVLVLLDGHRINDNLFDSGTIAREGMVEVELIDRVEVLRGPGSSMYGSSAFLAVVNVVTKNGAELDGLEMGVDAGSFDAYRSRLTFGEKFASGLDLVVSGTHYASEGPERLYYPEFDQRISDNEEAANDGVAYRLDDEDAWNLFARASYGEFSVSGLYLERAKNVPTASFSTVFNEREWTQDARAYLDVRYDHRFADDLRVQGSVFVDEYRYTGSYPYDYAEPGDPADIVAMIDGALGQWVGSEWQLSARLRDRHTLVAGVEYRNNVREHQYWYDDLEPRVYTLDDERSSSTLGVFGQGEFELRRDLILTAGARYDRYDTFGGHLSPRAGLIYSPRETSVVKALYGHAFRAPNPYELYYYFLEQSAHPPLDPERIDTYELVYEQYLGPALRLAVSGYHYDIQDLLSQRMSEAGEYYYDNLDRARARGVEIELAADFASGISSTASFTLQRARDIVNDRELSNSPRRMAKLNLSAPLLREKLTAGLELHYQSEAYTLSGGQADEFVIANLNLTSRSLWLGFEASVAVYNVFDKRYSYPAAEDHTQDVIEQDGRSFRGSLTYRF